MTVLSHLGDEDTRVATFLLGEVLNYVEGSLKLILTFVTSLGGSLFAVSTTDNVFLGYMTTKNVFEGF